MLHIFVPNTTLCSSFSTMLTLIRRTFENLRHHRHPYSLQTCRHRRRLHTKVTGLYGFDHLKTPKGFQRFVDDAIERSDELVAYISGMPSSAEIIRAMDEISNTICCVLNSAVLCQHTHPEREYVEEANKAALRISEYQQFIDTKRTLYEAVIKAEEGPLLTKEAQRVARNLRVDFEKGGIHLSAEKLDRVDQLNVEVSQLCQEFNDNIMIDPGSVNIFPASGIPKRLHHLVKPIYRSAPGDSGVLSKSSGYKKEPGYQISTEPGTLFQILQWVSDAEVRRMAYVQGNSVPRANIAVLDKLIATRHEIAQIMGHKSYAEFFLHSNMAKSSEVVSSFLLEMSKMVRPKADEEFRTMRDFKRKTSGQINEDLEPWDESHYTWMIGSNAYNLESWVVTSYFPLSRCIEGLKVLVESLFGATFHNIPLEPGESWHQDVLKLSLHHPDEGDLGYLYLDLFSRKRKYPGCAHFEIKGRRKISDTEYQLPVVALVCNFSGSTNSSTARLYHCEVVHLFHEFGHALHSLLSRTNYQRFSGTNVVLDLVETPSSLFEYYAWDYRFLQTFAKHYSTNEVIPKKLVQSLQGAKKMFAATELQHQIFCAMMDQTLFGQQPSPSRDTVSIVKDLKEKYTSSKHVEGTHWHTRFSHLLYYGAGYYSYLYAKCFASTIWKTVCEEDPLSLATGTALRTNFLQHGGSKDPACTLNDLVGGVGILKYHQNGGTLPDITSLCEEMNIVHPKQ